MNHASDKSRRSRILAEDIFVILCIAALWPRILGWEGVHFAIIMYVAVIGLIVILYRRIRRIGQVTDERRKDDDTTPNKMHLE